ncbi:zinc ribbon domain-containing protein [Hamadaea sp. NPDC051192]|uniref:zinc ribbon domain-containing protein n=1 Tax=Hamadaea sp. NPDC051192 TaxID=3154940 RepID=UPI003444855B
MYLLTGLIFCQDCGRRLEAHWTHGRPGYRCRHGHTATRRPTSELRTVDAREEQLLLLFAEQAPELGSFAGQSDRLRELIAGYLADHEVAVRCGFYTWQFEVDGELVFDGWPPHVTRVDNGPAATSQGSTRRCPIGQRLCISVGGLTCPRGDSAT